MLLGVPPNGEPQNPKPISRVVGNESEVASEDLDWEEQARYPLRKSSVSVRENPAKPGHFLSVIHLVPHYQLEQMVSELELVTELVQT